MTDHRDEAWRSAGRFAMTAVTPMARVGRVAQWVTLGLALVTLIGVGSFASPWAWVVLFALVAGLAAWAGIRLQLAEDVRQQPNFWAQLDYRRSRNASAASYKETAWLWVTVENRGPAAEFLGRVRNVSGIENSGDYEVEAIAWEYGRDRSRHLIERGGRERLRLGETRRSGSTPEEPKVRSLRFFIPHAGMWGSSKPPVQGMGKELTPTQKVTFRLEIVNVTEDLQRDYHVLLLFDADGTVADFRFDV